MKLLSIVAPAHNEAIVLPRFHERVAAAVGELGLHVEILFVDDGSTDGTREVLAALQRSDPRVGVVELSRCFGKELAVAAGLDFARGDAVVVIDSDLQDPPELIPQLVHEWREGYDVVYGTRVSRAGESWLKRATAYLFYRILGRAAPVDAGDFRLLSRRAVDAVTSLPERARYLRGLSTWIGYRQKSIPFHREARAAGVSKFGYGAMGKLALDALLSFGTLPMRFLGGAGALALVAGLVVLALPGADILVALVLLLGGLQLLAITLIGMSVARAHAEVRARPLYLVARYGPPGAPLIPQSRLAYSASPAPDPSRERPLRG